MESTCCGYSGAADARAAGESNAMASERRRRPSLVGAHAVAGVPRRAPRGAA